MERKYIILIIVISILLLGILGLVLFLILRKDNNSKLKIKEGVPQKFIDTVKAFYSKDEFPNITEEDQIKIINNRWNNPNKPNCNKDSTDFEADCDLNRIIWSCGLEGRADYIHSAINADYDNKNKPIKDMNEEEIKEFMKTWLKPEVYGVSCSHLYPNNLPVKTITNPNPTPTERKIHWNNTYKNKPYTKVDKASIDRIKEVVLPRANTYNKDLSKYFPTL